MSVNPSGTNLHTTRHGVTPKCTFRDLQTENRLNFLQIYRFSDTRISPVMSVLYHDIVTENNDGIICISKYFLTFKTTFFEESCVDSISVFVLISSISQIRWKMRFINITLLWIVFISACVTVPSRTLRSSIPHFLSFLNLCIPSSSK